MDLFDTKDCHTQILLVVRLGEGDIALALVVPDVAEASNDVLLS